MLAPSPYRAKDFCVVRKDGLYHVFYIRNNVTLPLAQTEKDLGHATSPNLWDWTQWPTVMPNRTGNWDNEHVWAPSIVLKDGVYWMFYTATTTTPGQYASFQRIGVATSTDLFNWNRFDAPVLSCDQVPWSYCDPLNAKTAFRDPFVMADPANPGGWLMYYSGSVTYDSSMVVGVARSDGDLTQWYDLMPMWNTYWSYTGGYITESPHVFRYKGLWYLFFTTVASQPLTFETANDPLAPPWDWTWRGRLGDMLGLNTAAWYASEQFRDGLVDYFCFVEADRIAFYKMGTNSTDYRFFLIQPDRFRMQAIRWGADSASVNAQVPLSFKSVFSTGKSADIEVLQQLGDGSLRLVPADSLGLPAPVPLTSDSTVISWAARALPDTVAPHAPQRFVVRMKDQTATSAALVVRRDSVPPTDPPPVNPPNPPIGYDDGTQDAGLIRPLRQSPYEGTALLLSMPAEAPARVDVYDLQGRRLRTLADRVLPRGANVLAWDGRTDDGVRVGPGVYFVRLVSKPFTGATRLVRLR